MRPIDADALLESLEESCQALRDTLEIPLSDNDRLCAKWQLVCFLENKMRVRNSSTLTLDDLRPKGRWEECDWVRYDGHSECVHFPRDGLVCTNCRNAFKKELLWKDNYCPNCGADMRGGGEDA